MPVPIRAPVPPPPGVMPYQPPPQSQPLPQPRPAQAPIPSAVAPYQPQPQFAVQPTPQPALSPVVPVQPQAEADEGVSSEPRLTMGGRTDLSGLNAIMFVILVIVAFAAGAYLLFNFIAIGAGPATPPPSLSAAVVTANASGAAASESPGPSEPPGQTILPSDAVVNDPGEPLNVVVDGNVVGSVTVKELKWPTKVNGASPPAGTLWLTAQVSYDATEGDIAYSSSDWTLIDESHVVIVPSTTQKAPQLGSGTVSDGTKQDGIITYLVPSNTTVVLHFSSGDSTGDFKVKPK